MAIKYERLTVPVSGADGSAAGAGKTPPITGLLLAIHIDYVTQPATADVTIATAGSTVPALTLLVASNSATDGWYFPRAKVHDTAGAAATAASDVMPVADAVSVSVAQGNAGSVVVSLVYEG